MSRHPAVQWCAWALLVAPGVAAAAVGAPVALVSLSAAVAAVGIIIWAAAPCASRVCRRCWHSMPAPSAARLSTWTAAMAYASPEYVAFQARPGLCELTDEQLCSEWQASYAALQRCATSRARLRTVQQRQRYLDELARRHPGGLTAWLLSDAEAGTSPWRYLVQSGSHHTAIDWDELMREQGW